MIQFMSIIELLRFHFSLIETKLDKRQQSKIKYQMQDVLILIVLGLLSGYDTIIICINKIKRFKNIRIN